MKVHRLEVMVLDWEGFDHETIAAHIERNWPTQTITNVMSHDDVEIGEWSDDHPLNQRDTQRETFDALFAGWQPEGQVKP